MTMTSDDQAFIEGVRARCDAATEGPWVEGGEFEDDCHAFTVWTVETEHHILSLADCQDYPPYFIGGLNAEFIAHSRTDIPQLLAIISRLEAENGKLRKIGLAYISKLGQEMELELDNPTATATPQAQEQSDMLWAGDSLNLPDPEDPRHPWNKGVDEGEKEATE